MIITYLSRHNPKRVGEYFLNNKLRSYCSIGCGVGCDVIDFLLFIKNADPVYWSNYIYHGFDSNKNAITYLNTKTYQTSIILYDNKEHDYLNYIVATDDTIKYPYPIIKNKICQNTKNYLIIIIH